MKLERRSTMLGLLAAALAISSGLAYATIPGGGVIHGRYLKSGGALRNSLGVVSSLET